MTTVSTIISDALRESNLIAISATPTTAETTEALRLLNRYVRWLFSRGQLAVYNYGANITYGGDQATQYDISASVDTSYAPDNARLMLNLSEAKTIDLCPLPQDGARFSVVDAANNLNTYNLTLNSNGRLIESSPSLTLSINGLTREWFYRQDTGNWARISDLASTDESPFPQEFDDLFVIGLAMRLNPRNGVAADPQSVQMYKDLLTAFRSRYFQNKEIQSDEALLHLSLNRYGTYGDDGTRFNRGQ